MSRGAIAALTTFGLGFMRPASGTWGSLPPVGVAGAILLAGALLGNGAGAGAGPGAAAAWHGATWVVYHTTLVVILVAFSLACVRFGDLAEARFGRKDPGQVVADETAGQCIPLMLLPASALDTWVEAGATLAGAFVLFRILDILKPWPAGGLQRLPGGWGILVDDLVAGVQAAIIMQVVTRVIL
jgi:phosphatidylglycerophosphatase A